MVCRFMVLEIAEAIDEILAGDPNVTMDEIIDQLKIKFPDIPHPGFEGRGHSAAARYRSCSRKLHPFLHRSWRGVGTRGTGIL